MEFTRKRSPAISVASPTRSNYLQRIGANFILSTPAGTARPLPEFLETNNNKLYQFRNHQPFHSKALMPKSPVKSAPPISRMFPHRQWATEKAHTVSFRDESNLLDSTIQSKFYNSERSELYFEQCFTIEKKMGEGSFGEVMKVKSLDNGRLYAVKRSREKFRNKADRMRKLDEVKKHEQLPKHPNCVEFVKAWEENRRLYIQTELCMMSVQEYWESKGSVSEERVWSILIDLLHGLYHIHKHGFIHLDIKPANIFLSDMGDCKIGDFGLVIDHREIADAREGDTKYMAPELLNSVFSAKADIFSLGIATLELASNIELPRDGTAWRLLRLGYIPPECIECLGTDLHCVIQWMLTPDPEERPAVEDILQHPIIANHCRKQIPFKMYKACLEFCYSMSAFASCLLWKLLSLSFAILMRPLFIFQGVRSCHSSFRAQRNSANNSANYKWESTDSNDLYSSSSSESGPPSASQHQSVVFFTPSVKSRSRSRFTPTPRNSSPVASRVELQALAGNISPDISPLLHNKSHCNRFNCSDMEKLSSDHDDYTYYSGSLLASKRRNLSELLNNVSDSDNSVQGTP